MRNARFDRKQCCPRSVTIIIMYNNGVFKYLNVRYYLRTRSSRARVSLLENITYFVIAGKTVKIQILLHNAVQNTKLHYNTRTYTSYKTLRRIPNVIILLFRIPFKYTSVPSTIQILFLFFPKVRLVPFS